ncbi:MAG: putative DNA binding domain-containing protein [Elusimicrobiota bacterium]|jgi:predicted HTH transcriptional regulator|nr:putative DNA binding domain-containing protein [Elusimicrobiota bacterium]
MKTTETNRIEYKQILTDDLEKEAVAFLNSTGGEICIGIKDDGTIIGVSKPDATHTKIKDKLINKSRPNIMGLFDIFTEDMDDKIIIIVKLAGGSETPYYIKQKGRSEAGCFIRVGSSAQPMPEEIIDKLMAKRHPTSLANIPSRHQDLTFNQLKIFYEEKGKLLNSNFAKSLDLLLPDGKYNQLAYMFSDINNISIRVAKWWGTEKIDLRENEEYGYCSLIKAMQKVLDKFELENITQARKVGIGARQEKSLVDNKALREAIINAFAHNDYSSQETPVFEIFSDRFEITTYGGLVEGLTKEEFFTGVSKLRNREIMRIFKDIEFVERLGSGMPYIVKKYGRNIFNFMNCVIKSAFHYDQSINNDGKDKTDSMEESKEESREESREKSKEKSKEKSREKNIRKIENREKILKAIKQNSEITTQELASLIGISVAGIEKNIKQMKLQNLIRRIGPDKGGHWEVVE